MYRANHSLYYVGYAITSVPVRLVGGSSSTEGRVELSINGEWGTVCNDGWDFADAKVVCRMLGYPGVIGTAEVDTFGQGSGTIWLDNVDCSGYESSLSECTHKGWGAQRGCDHSQDVGVICSGKRILTD